jgi:hypothetical protein
MNTLMLFYNSPSQIFVPLETILTTQSDGNVVIYNSNFDFVWGTGRLRQCTTVRFVMQTDGNLVEYCDGGAGGVIWASNTQGKGTGPYTLSLNNDGSLTIKDGSGNQMWKNS